ncbi:MAG: hypothetical protein ACI9MR_000170 [Myxococcota bacterium]|jgi:hypothetical protein
MVWDFFKNLGRQKMTGIEAKMKGKVMGAQAKAKMKASGAVNKGIKSAGDKAKAKATGAVKGKGKGQKKDKAEKQKDEKMGLFGKKNRTESAPAVQAAEPENFGDKTQFIQAIVDDGPQACVGWLVALNTALKGQDFRLVDGKNMIGTAADSDIVLTDQYMSSRHAVMRHEDGIFVLVDLDSTNGTYVNDQKISKEELIDNDKVRLGRTELKFKSLY